MSTITRAQAQKIIEAADEVITALAGTNEDVHPESDNMLRLWDDLNDRYAPPEVVRELARIALASIEAVPSPELLCQFVMQNYANYQGAWLCGKSSEILSFLLTMAGHDCEKVACTINGVGHLYVRCGDLILDPSIAQFGDYPEISRGKHPCTGMGYVENSTEPQKYRNASSDSDIIRAMKIAPASLEAEPVAYMHRNGQVVTREECCDDKTFAICCKVETPLYTAPPAPLSVPDEATPENIEILASTYAPRGITYQWDKDECNAAADSWNACRAAMLHGAEPVTTANKLPFDQWLSQQTGTIDVECGCVMTEVFFHWLRVAYEAGNSPVIPDGWVLVPVEPTVNQWAAGMQAFDSGVDKVTRVYKAMLAAALQQEVKL